MSGDSSKHEGSRQLTVGIVGGGIAGLYTALLLRREGVNFHVFEGSGIVGGRIRTHYFSQEKDQYFEAGAMRIPYSKFHEITFDLIKYLNVKAGSSDRKIELINYVLNTKGNHLYVNNLRIDTGSGLVDNTTPAQIKWDVPAKYKNIPARELMLKAIGPYLERLKKGPFEEEFCNIIREVDNLSFRYFLQYPPKNAGRTENEGYPPSVIDFMETVLSQTNQYMLSVPELLMQNLDFGEPESEWKTINHGMSRLPEAMAALVTHDKITYGARVNSLELVKSEDYPNGGVIVSAVGYNGQLKMTFDKVVLAIPPAAIKMLISHPPWSPEKDMAIRSVHSEALFKMGMRFKRRFWENVENPSMGGQSTTDLPIRWVVFPSNGLGSDGTGVLLVYAWMTDATTWLPLTPIERRQLAINNLEQLYSGLLKKGEITSLLMETSDAIWSQSTATGDAMFLPGQFLNRFDAARKPEDNIYFAGEHLSFHHTWISGLQVRQIRQ
ncbi:FAD/NAD(P)-binding domain-containing protein [Dendrothele bispora CBS 962.96]|uniref:FAD/NAD(P)-binding domain-containing protein n=1 Tax=Dendrothele bispora (strain CBS 962.96) TaxID=1314807 RepID=A0A4V4HCH7_DENBC|nr:FAD/NAD(P)-binding domain-containing protein [Dendrothele bispora CBS 962.96]